MRKPESQTGNEYLHSFAVSRFGKLCHEKAPKKHFFTESSSDAH